VPSTAWPAPVCPTTAALPFHVLHLCLTSYANGTPVSGYVCDRIQDYRFTATNGPERCSIVLIRVSMRSVGGRRSKSFVGVTVGMVLISACHEVKEPLSRIDLSEVRTADQLLSGFYQLENGAWRWTAREFSAGLRPPDGAEQRGATLELYFYLPDFQVEALGPMTLSASTGTYELSPQTFSKGGTYIYSRKVPKEALATSLLPVTFSFDKATEPLTSDGRELAAIVSKIELQTD
jgi:hypothetical protein